MTFYCTGAAEGAGGGCWANVERVKSVSPRSISHPTTATATSFQTSLRKRITVVLAGHRLHLGRRNTGYVIGAW